MMMYHNVVYSTVILDAMGHLFIAVSQIYCCVCSERIFEIARLLDILAKSRGNDD